MSERLVTLDELIKSGVMTLGDGYRTKKAEHGKPGIPILRAAEVRDGVIRPEFADYVSEAYRLSIGSKVSKPGDVVLTTKGTVGRVAVVPANLPEFVYSPQVCFFRVFAEAELDRRYLYYWFKSDKFWSQATSRKSQTDMADYLNLADIRSLVIGLPSAKTQRAIAAVLGALDDKIAANDRAAVLACDLMEAHFRLETECTSIKQELGEVVTFHNRRRIPLSARQRAEMPGSYPYYGAAGVIDHVRDYLFRGPHVLVGEDGTVIANDGKPVTQYVWGDFWVNNHAHVLTGAGISTELLAVALRFADVSSLVTGAVQPKLNMGNLGRLRVTLPLQEKRPNLDVVVSQLWVVVRQRQDESRTLAALRDTLLPQLMSGKLRVRDAERIVEDVV